MRPGYLGIDLLCQANSHLCRLEYLPFLFHVIDNQVQVSGMRSNLVLMITHPEPELIFLSFVESETGAAELVVKKRLNLLDRSPRLSEFFNDVLVHPSGTLAVVHCYSGKLKVVVLKAGSYQQDFDVSYVFSSFNKHPPSHIIYDPASQNLTFSLSPFYQTWTTTTLWQSFI